MMMKRACLCWSIISVVLLFWGCNTARIPVDLFGGSVDLSLLEGEWKGEYFSKDTGRSGTLEFTLTTEKERAFGNVLMIPRGSQEPYRPAGFRDKAEVDPRFPELLTISFVKVMGGKVRGELTPYMDPDMQRRLYTTFEGVVMEDTIEGTFESRIEGSPIYFYGQWIVYRRKSKNIG